MSFLTALTPAGMDINRMHEFYEELSGLAGVRCGCDHQVHDVSQRSSIHSMLPEPHDNRLGLLGTIACCLALPRLNLNRHECACKSRQLQSKEVVTYAKLARRQDVNALQERRSIRIERSACLGSPT